MRELSAEGVDTCFLKGKNSLINAACPYREGSLAEHWWTRGFAYSELERVVSSNAETERGQREWVGLTDEEVMILAAKSGFYIDRDEFDEDESDLLNNLHLVDGDGGWSDDLLFKLRDLFEAKLKEKNT